MESGGLEGDIDDVDYIWTYIQRKKKNLRQQLQTYKKIIHIVINDNNTLLFAPGLFLYSFALVSKNRSIQPNKQTERNDNERTACRDLQAIVLYMQEKRGLNVLLVWISNCRLVFQYGIRLNSSIQYMIARMILCILVLHLISVNNFLQGKIVNFA